MFIVMRDCSLDERGYFETVIINCNKYNLIKKSNDNNCVMEFYSYDKAQPDKLFFKDEIGMKYQFDNLTHAIFLNTPA